MNTLIVCHNPTNPTQGNVTWEGHNIIGYVDITPVGKLKTPPNTPYYDGWETVPATLKGRADVVLSLYCEGLGDFQRGSITSFDEEQTLPTGRKYKLPLYNDIFVKAFEYVKPGGVMLFAGWDESIKTLNGAENPSWTLLKNTFGEGNLSFGTFTEDINYKGSTTKVGTSFLQIRKPAGGRRRKTRRVHRKNAATSRVYPRVQRRLRRTRSMNSSNTRLKRL